jgi:hypothetical protein
MNATIYSPFQAVFYLLCGIAGILAILPYVWTRLFGYEVSSVTVDVTCAIAWLACFTLALWTQHWRWRRCIPLLAAAPFACGPASHTLFVLLIWHFNGFAP